MVGQTFGFLFTDEWKYLLPVVKTRQNTILHQLELTAMLSNTRRIDKCFGVLIAYQCVLCRISSIALVTAKSTSRLCKLCNGRKMVSIFQQGMLSIHMN